MAKETGLSWLHRHLDYGGDDCLIWPFSRDTHGYAQMGFAGKVVKAHRYVCGMVHGTAPSLDHQASHSCGNGHAGCINPRHIFWKTRRDNHLDRRLHGTARTNPHGRAGKVTAQMAAEIVALKGKCSQQAIADVFEISKPTVRRIFKAAGCRMTEQR